MQTQVLFGQEVLVTEERRGWAHVLIPNQPTSQNSGGYPGWIPIEQLIKHENWNLDGDPIVVVTSKKAFLYDENSEPFMELCFQTILPYQKEQNGKAFVQTPGGAGSINVENILIYESLNTIPKGSGKEIVATGEQFLHLPYLWGGMSSYGYDCSGFCYLMCKANGYDIPRDAHDQAKVGMAVNLSEIKPGDLLFFAKDMGKGRIHHVGIYYGQGKLLHSPYTGKTIEIIPLKGTKYETELCLARRFWIE
ncbi:C40 family peptidase [Neobacillus sp. PS3-40]|uniref:C40 family peptidase n=1 Tax=Neobacillus sp. PS3-40 TaxID=3070679 RepID=UPI0027E0E18E|nr:C40 family peptidase [Neobacillus sp. PS3-40]WML44117.1 C40 family peptidase [Neobacillus sp. PS3-40]